MEFSPDNDLGDEDLDELDELDKLDKLDELDTG